MERAPPPLALKTRTGLAKDEVVRPEDGAVRAGPNRVHGARLCVTGVEERAGGRERAGEVREEGGERGAKNVDVQPSPLPLTQFHQDGPRHVAAARGLVEVDIDTLELEVGVTVVGACVEGSGVFRRTR